MLEQSPDSEISRTLLEAIHQIVPEEPALFGSAPVAPTETATTDGMFRRIYRTFVPADDH